MKDVLIAGAGIAGSALAIHLARRGYSVVLVERSRFPREKPCGEGVMPAGVAALERLVLLCYKQSQAPSVTKRAGGELLDKMSGNLNS